jgi:hypothetical protein
MGQNRYISTKRAAGQRGKWIAPRALSLSMEIKNIKLSLFCVCVLEFSPGHKAGCTGHLYQRFFIGGFVQSGARLNVQNIIRHAAFKLQDDDLYTHAADSVSRSGKKF